MKKKTPPVCHRGEQITPVPKGVLDKMATYLRQTASPVLPVLCAYCGDRIPPQSPYKHFCGRDCSEADLLRYTIGRPGSVPRVVASITCNHCGSKVEACHCPERDKEKT